MTRSIQLCEDTESLHLKKNCASFLKCTKFRIGDLSLGLDRAKETCFFICTEIAGEQVTCDFSKNY